MLGCRVLWSGQGVAKVSGARGQNILMAPMDLKENLNLRKTLTRKKVTRHYSQKPYYY